MFTKKTFAVGAMAALGMAVSGGATAGTFYPAGPIDINGHVSVDNTPKGGDYTAFNCKVVGHGIIRQAPFGNQQELHILALQARSNGSGQIPRGCHLVQTANFPWIMTVTAGVPQLTRVAFQAVGTGQPGCGTDGSATPWPGNATGGTVGGVWIEDPLTPNGGPGSPSPIPGPIVMADAAYSLYQTNNATIVDSDPSGNCLITGTLKFSRPVAPVNR